MPQFKFETREINNVMVINLIGSLIESSQGSVLLAYVEQLIEEKRTKFILNLENFVYMNSSGLSVIINLLTKARKNDGDVAICNINKKANEILVITKLNSVFSVFDTEMEALEMFQ